MSTRWSLKDLADRSARSLRPAVVSRDPQAAQPKQRHHHTWSARLLTVGGLAAVTTLGIGTVATAGNEPRPTSPTIVDTLPPVPEPTPSTGTITVSGTGVVKVEPDTALVNLGVQADAPTGAEAMESVNANATALTEALVAAGIVETDIQTSGLNLYSTTGDDGVTVTGYNASLTVNVTVHDIDTVGSIIDTAQQAGGEGFTIGGVSFSFADPESVLEQARIDALDNARTKAEQYAAAAGVGLGAVLSIVESGSSPPVLYADVAAMPREEAAAAGPPISPGQLDLTIDITVTYATV